MWKTLEIDDRSQEQRAIEWKREASGEINEERECFEWIWGDDWKIKR